MKTGLVMEGGAMRGLYTAGVMDVLMENGIVFDGGIGVSAGAVFGCNYKSKQIGRVLRYNKNYCKDDRYGSFKSFFRCGYLYEPEFCYETIPFKLDPFDSIAYRNNPMEFYVVATSMETGKAVYHKCVEGDRYDCKWLLASASMPLVSRIVEIDGHGYLDGGMADSIPLKAFEDRGYNRNVVVLTQPKGYVKKPAPYYSLIRMMYRKYPEMVKVMCNRHVHYNAALEYIAKKEETGEIIAIYPKEELNISGTCSDPAELERVYNAGREAALAKIDEIKAFLKAE